MDKISTISDELIKKPALVNYPVIGAPETGFIAVAEMGVNVPFEIKRVYWIYATPKEVTRGGHAHKNLEQVVFAVSGVIEVNCESVTGEKRKIVLRNPHTGLYIPRLTWRNIEFSEDAIMLCLASALYDEDDYIRDYNSFTSFGQLQ